MAATIPTFRFPEDTIFHGIAGVDRGFTHGDFRALTTDVEKFQHLKKRLDDFLYNSVNDITHAFTKAVLTCIGCEVLGQIIHGPKNEFWPDDESTKKIYESLDNRLAVNFSPVFFTKFSQPASKVPKKLTKPDAPYSDLIIQGLRNQYVHSYRPYAVLLSDQLQDFIQIIESQGYIIINSTRFWEKFKIFYEKTFSELILGTSAYETTAIKYLEYLA